MPQRSRGPGLVLEPAYDLTLAGLLRKQDLDGDTTPDQHVLRFVHGAHAAAADAAFDPIAAGDHPPEVGVRRRLEFVRRARHRSAARAQLGTQLARSKPESLATWHTRVQVLIDGAERIAGQPTVE